MVRRAMGVPSVSHSKQVRIVRGWMLFAVAAVLWLAFPRWEWSLILLGMVPCCCEACSCSNCDSGTAPNEYQVVITGVTNQSCSDCANENTTWILQCVSECRWEATGPVLCSSATTKYLEFQTGAARIFISNTVRDVIWLKSYTFPIDCQLSGETLTPSATLSCGQGGGSSCTVSAV